MICSYYIGSMDLCQWDIHGTYFLRRYADIHKSYTYFERSGVIYHKIVGKPLQIVVSYD